MKCECGSDVESIEHFQNHRRFCDKKLIPTKSEEAVLRDKVTALELQVDEYQIRVAQLQDDVRAANRLVGVLRNALEAITDMADAGGSIWLAAHTAIKETQIERPKSDGWHCPLCNLITERAGLTCSRCCGCLVVGTHRTDCHHYTEKRNDEAKCNCGDEMHRASCPLGR